MCPIQDAIVAAIVGAGKIYGLGMGELPSAIAAMMDLQLHIMDLVDVSEHACPAGRRDPIR